MPMKMEQTECSETSAYKILMPQNYPEESIQHLQHGESFKSRNNVFLTYAKTWAMQGEGKNLSSFYSSVPKCLKSFNHISM
jgi:hypothetical protein